MESSKSLMSRTVNRRSLLKNGALAGGAVAIGAGLIAGETRAFGQSSSGSLNKGDIAILRFLAAAELIESDLWQQYAELGGVTHELRIRINLLFKILIPMGRNTFPVTHSTSRAMQIF